VRLGKIFMVYRPVIPAKKNDTANDVLVYILIFGRSWGLPGLPMLGITS
jgi:hypothetical protein